MLPAQTPSSARLTEDASAFIFYPHGVTMDKWLPATEGAGFEFTPILKPLEPSATTSSRSATRMRRMAYGADASAAANHSSSSAVFLTGAKPDEESAAGAGRIRGSGGGKSHRSGHAVAFDRNDS